MPMVSIASEFRPHPLFLGNSVAAFKKDTGVTVWAKGEDIHASFSAANGAVFLPLTAFGGSAEDSCQGIVLDSSGNPIVQGSMGSTQLKVGTTKVYSSNSQKLIWLMKMATADGAITWVRQSDPAGGQITLLDRSLATDGTNLFIAGLTDALATVKVIGEFGISL